MQRWYSSASHTLSPSMAHRFPRVTKFATESTTLSTRSKRRDASGTASGTRIRSAANPTPDCRKRSVPATSWRSRSTSTAYHQPRSLPASFPRLIRRGFSEGVRRASCEKPIEFRSRTVRAGPTRGSWPRGNKQQHSPRRGAYPGRDTSMPRGDFPPGRPGPCEGSRSGAAEGSARDSPWRHQ